MYLHFHLQIWYYHLNYHYTLFQLFFLFLLLLKFYWNFHQLVLIQYSEMLRPESGDGGMIRHLPSFQQIHVVDVPAAVLFDRS